MSQFLVIYDRSGGHLIGEIREFSNECRADALAARAEAEAAFADFGSPVEIVVLGARSRADLETTHRRYFHDLADLAGSAAG